MKEVQLLFILIVTITAVHAFSIKNQLDQSRKTLPKSTQPVNVVSPGNNKTVPAININHMEKEIKIKKMYQPSFYRYHRLRNRVDNNIAILAKNEVINQFTRIIPSQV